MITSQVDFDDDIIALLSEITEFKSAETSSHVTRIKEYSYILSQLYGLFEEEAKVIAKMSLLHDIGKICTPDTILNKPGKLSEDEFEAMKLHTLNGEMLLKKAFKSNPKMGNIATEIALEIPIHARIVALVDVFDALMNKRVYKDAWELDDALSFIEQNSGVKFEPKLVKLLLLNIDCFLNILAKYSNEEDVGHCKILKT